MTNIKRLPRRFYDDQCSRCLEIPDPVKESKRFVWLDLDHPDMAELRSDAEHYSDYDSWSDDAEENAANRPLASAARRLLKALA